MKSGMNQAIAGSPAAAGEASGPSIRAMKQVFDMLDDHLQIRNPGTAKADAVYRSGWTDERVAKESGLSIDQVKRIRIESYAELADTELEKLSADLAAVKGLLLDLEHRIETLRSKRAA